MPSAMHNRYYFNGIGSQLINNGIMKTMNQCPAQRFPEPLAAFRIPRDEINLALHIEKKFPP